MDDEKIADVICFSGLGNSRLANEVLRELKEYIGERTKQGFVDYRRWADGEYADMINDYQKIRGKILVFFECLKEVEVMVRFLQLCWAAKHQYGAKNIVAVLSFMHYRRQDRFGGKYEGEIQRNRWLVQQMKNSGISHVILVTPHSDQIRKNFEEEGIFFKELDLSELFASRLRPLLPYDKEKKEKVKVYSPDEGSINRAINLAKCLNVGVVFGLKSRDLDNETKIVEADQAKIDEVKEQFSFFPNLEYATPELVNGSIIIIAEDEVDTGGTANKKAELLQEHGAKKIYMFFTHAVCTGSWKQKLFGEANPFSQVIVSNTIQRKEEQRTGGKVHDVSIASALAPELFQMLHQEVSGE